MWPWPRIRIGTWNVCKVRHRRYQTGSAGVLDQQVPYGDVDGWLVHVGREDSGAIGIVHLDRRSGIPCHGIEERSQRIAILRFIGDISYGQGLHSAHVRCGQFVPVLDGRGVCRGFSGDHQKEAGEDEDCDKTCHWIATVDDWRPGRRVGNS